MQAKDPPTQNDSDADAEFTPGDRVLDREHLRSYPTPYCDHETPGVGVVLDVLDLRADELSIDEGYTVADHNHDYPADDRLIQVAFEAEIDAHATTWRDWDAEAVQAVVVKNGDTPPPWHFPASRLLSVSEAVARSAWDGAVDAALDGGGADA